MELSLLTETKSAVRSILISSTDKMTIQQVEKDFKLLMGNALPYNKLGYQSAEQFLKSIPDILKVHGSGCHAFVDCVPNEKSEHIRNFVQNQKRDTRTRTRRNRNGGRMYNNNRYINTYPNACDFNDFNKEFQGKLNVSKESDKINNIKGNNNRFVNSSESGTYSSNESNSNESRNNGNKSERETEKTTLDVDRPKANKNYSNREEKFVNDETEYIYLGARRIPIGRTEKPHNSKDEALPPCAVPENIDLLDRSQTNSVQRISLSSNFKFPPQCELYETLKIGSIISLYVCEVQNPLLFFFHANIDDHQLLKLTEEMKKTYSNLAPKELRMADSFIHPGALCSAKIDDLWYRVKILDIPNCLNDFSKVKILVIDYGCVCKVSVRNLKYLLNEFLYIPIQSVRGCLANIKPSKQLFNITDYFQSLVLNRCLYAYIVDINKDSLYVEVKLVDTNVSPTLKINEEIQRKLRETNLTFPPKFNKISQQ